VRDHRGITNPTISASATLAVGGSLPASAMIVRKPKFEAAAWADLAMYSTGQLRARYDAAAGSHDTPIRLRNSVLTRAEIAAVIRWREHRQSTVIWFG
jgi:hypothetical protein